MNGLIVYTSRYGATRDYALWLAEETGYPVMGFPDIEKDALEAADLLIVGSSIRVGRLQAARWLEKNWPRLAEKEVILFSVSLTPPEDEEIAKIVERSISQEIIEAVHYFPLPGRLAPEKLSFLDRQMTRFAARAEENPARKSALTQGVDNVDRGRLAPLLDAIGSLEKDFPGG